jgi:hypothetical protein
LNEVPTSDISGTGYSFVSWGVIVHITVHANKIKTTRVSSCLVFKRVCALLVQNCFWGHTRAGVRRRARTGSIRGPCEVHMGSGTIPMDSAVRSHHPLRESKKCLLLSEVRHRLLKRMIEEMTTPNHSGDSPPQDRPGKMKIVEQL